MAVATPQVVESAFVVKDIPPERVKADIVEQLDTLALPDVTRTASQKAKVVAAVEVERPNDPLSDHCSHCSEPPLHPLESDY